VALAHLSATAVLAISFCHFVFTAASSAVFAAGGSVFAAISLRSFVLAAAGSAIFATGSALFAAIALGHFVLTAATGAVFATSGSVFAAGGVRSSGLVSRSRGRTLRPHADGE